MNPQIYVVPEVVGLYARAYYNRLAGDHVTMAALAYSDEVSISCSICNTTERVSYSAAIDPEVVRVISKHAHRD